MHSHRADLPLLDPDVLPGLTGVGGAIDAVAFGNVAARIRFTGSHIDHVGIRWCDRDRTGRRDRLLVENRLPFKPAVNRLPHPTRSCGRVVGQRIAVDPGDTRDSTSSGRTDQAIGQSL